MIWKALRTKLLLVIGLLGPLVVAGGAPAAPFQDLGGTFWSSQGFGYVLEFDNPKTFVLYEVVSPLGSIRLTAGTLKSDGGATAQMESSGSADGGEVLGAIRASDGELRLRRTGGLEEIVFTRLAERPRILDQTPDASPQGVLEYFRRLMESHHAFLQQRLDELAIPAGLLPAGTTWDAIAIAAAKQVGPKTSRGQLCNVLWKLLEPLGDIHTSLSDPKNDQCGDSGIHPQTYATMFPNVPAHEVDEDKADERVAKAFKIVKDKFVDDRGLASIANGEHPLWRYPRPADPLHANRFVLGVRTGGRVRSGAREPPEGPRRSGCAL